MPPTIHQLGEALYGPRWQSELARQLGISDRTVRRWAAGAYEVPPSVIAELKAECLKRSKALLALSK